MRLSKTFRAWRPLALACGLSGALLGAYAQPASPAPAAGASAAAAPTAVAPARAASAAPPACPQAHEVGPAQVLGLWRAEFSGLWEGATLLIEKHPDYAGSLAGGINRNGQRGRLAGDMEDGELTLEESADGQRISATFLGDVVEGSCGREIRGTWQATGEKAGRAFVLRRQ